MLWTPQDIFEYKQTWKSDAFLVDVPVDYEWSADHWCKVVLMKHKWNKTKNIAPYYHRYEFEELIDAEQLVDVLKKEFNDLELKVEPKNNTWGIFDSAK